MPRLPSSRSRSPTGLGPGSLGRTGFGTAWFDFDNDGDTDVLVSNANAPPQLLVNHIGNRRHWLGLKLAGGEDGPRHMLGSRVAIMRDGASTIWRRARTDGSYASANDPRVLIGFGASADAPLVRVQWPSGRVEEWPDVAIDRWTTLREGSGTPSTR